MGEGGSSRLREEKEEMWVGTYYRRHLKHLDLNGIF